MVKVALVDVFSGPSGSTGRYMQNSIQAEIDRINAGGGLLGNRLELVSADDELKSQKAFELVREQLLDPDVRLLVGPGGNEAFGAVRGLIGQARLPNCVTAVGDNAVQGAPTTFRAEPKDSDRVAGLLGYLQKSQPALKKLGVIGEGDLRDQAYDRLVAGAAGTYGMAYAGHAVANPSDADLKPAVQQMLDAGAQAALFDGQTATGIRVAQAVKDLNATGRMTLLGFDSMASYDFASLGGDAAGGAVFATTIHSYLTDVPQAVWPAGYRGFIGGISHAYGTAPNGVEVQASAAAADCLLQWSKAVASAGTFSGQAVSTAWSRLEVPADEARLGVEERFSASDHDSVPKQGVFVYTWQKSGAGFKLKQLQTG